MTGVLIASGMMAAGAAVMTALDRRARRMAESSMEEDIARFEGESLAPEPAI